tara:strand:- start:117 stop:593 length:477 start_codon:yes stop_codon:yes gene_type:complete
MPQLATTRFTKDTWDENVAWRQSHNCINGCAYGTPKYICDNIEYDEVVYVLEMNNDINKIVGIGKIRNKIQLGIKKRDKKIYSDPFYCKYLYKGNRRIDRNELTEREVIIINILELIVFYGGGHLKRGHGITRMNPVILNRVKDIDLLEEIEYMFNRR